MTKRLWICFIAFAAITYPYMADAVIADEVDALIEGAYMNARASGANNYFIPQFVQTGPGGPITTIIDINSHGKRVGLRNQDALYIVLEGNGSTGYHWYFDDPIPDGIILQYTGKNVVDGRGPLNVNRLLVDGIVGRPIAHIWKFRAIKQGSATIRMRYYRIWEGREHAITQFEVGVDVN